MPLELHGLHDLGYKIMLDRYAHNDPNGRENLKVGDIVVAIIKGTGSDMQQSREIGRVTKIDGEEVTVAVHPDDNEVTLHISLIDRPLETTPQELQSRIAQGIASVEATQDKRDLWQREFEWLLDDWKFVPGGRIMAAAGTEQDLTYFNCYVISSPEDSRGGIMESVTEMAEIMSRGGGVGVNVSSLRPRNSYVAGVNGRSSGSVSWGALYSFVTGMIEQGGCFAGDTRIATDKGLIPIREIVERIEKGEDFHAQTHQGMRRITDKFRNGVQPLLKIRTKRGYEVKVTPNHPMTYLQDGKITKMRADMMVEGDELLISNVGAADSHIAGDNVQFEDVELPEGSTAVIHDTPKEMTPELAYLLGYSYGDGCVKSNHGVERYLSLACHSEHSTIRERLVASILDSFGYDASIYSRGEERVIEISVASLHIVTWLRHNGLLKEKAADIRVPEAIFRADRESILSFVAGYFDADGSVTKGKKTIKFSSISFEFLQDIQMLLGYCGIITQIHKYERPQENWQAIYELYVRGNVHKARFSEQVPTFKDTSLVVGKRDMTNVYPADVIAHYPSKYRQRIYDGKSERLSSNQLTKIATKAGTYGDDTAVMEIGELLNLTVDTIESIERVKEEETFDLTVEHNHLLSGNVIYTGNSRRGALMLILNDWHPDVFDFINSKREAGKITNANISVGISDRFMEAVKNDEEWELAFPETSFEAYDDEWDGNLERWVEKGYPINVYRTLPAREIWNAIIESAWASAEPGMWFRERSNKLSNSYYYVGGELISTNPCGEQPLSPNSVCNLGALNMAKFYSERTQDVDWELLRKSVVNATRFLDNVIDATPYHFEAHEKQQKSERRVGLGVMGLADLMIKCGVRYGSEESVRFTEGVFKFIAENAYATSAAIANEKGSFPYFDTDLFLESGYVSQMSDDVKELIRLYGMRNVTLLTVAPTGTTGTLQNTSTGIEPNFSWKWYRKGRLGFHEENSRIMREWLEENELDEIPEDLPDYFVTAMDLTPMEHVRVQAAAQKWVDSAISKTVNAPNDYTIEQTAELYMAMYDMGCKGGTIYRDGSRSEQVLMLDDGDKEADAGEADKSAEYDEAIEELDELAREYDEWLDEYDDNEDYIYDGEEFEELDITLPTHPEIMTSVTLRGKTPFGTMFINISEDPQGTPFAVFITVGKSGSDIHAFAESMGRTISIAIQSHPVQYRMSMLRALVDQNRGIGGSRPYGFGKNRVSSFADAVAKLIQEQYIDRKDLAEIAEAHLEEVYGGHTEVSVDTGYATVSTPEGDVVVSAGIEEHADDEDSEVRQIVSMEGGNMCPECHNMSLIRVDGCSKCAVCGYSEC